MAKKRAPTVPAGPFRDAVRRSELSKSEIARRIGYKNEVEIGGKTRVSPQTARLNNLLRQKRIGLDLARSLAEAMGIELIELVDSGEMPNAKR